MTDNVERIPFEVEVSRILEVLARQIYQSPLALLRENTQNAFDAILLRRHAGQHFEPLIQITISPDEIVIVDNGLGMTSMDLKGHYWRPGSSSKNTPEARDAGVVGTFGIGAMANFGIADELTVETESAITGERTLSSAEKVKLSTTEDCITLKSIEPLGVPGTRVVAKIPAGHAVDVAQAVQYIADFVAFVDVPVIVNGEIVSQHDLMEAVPASGDEIIELGPRTVTSEVTADVTLRVALTGDVWLRVSDVSFVGEPVPGSLVLRQNQSSIRTFRSGFGLATVSAASAYGLGGVADLAAFQPTAGREALTTQSMQFLQSLTSGLDNLISEQLAALPQCDANTNFMEWVRRNGRYELAGNLRTRVEPDSQRVELSRLRDQSKTKPLLTYDGSDASLIAAVATEDSNLVVLAGQNPRRQCEQQFLAQYCQTEAVPNAPTLLSEKPRSLWSLAEQALVFRIASILDADYFLAADVALGTISHGLPIVVEVGSTPRIVLDPSANTFSIVRELYNSDYSAFASMTKDYVRNIVFPRVAELVPSSTRQGAEAFLKTIRRTRDLFEYDLEDLDSLSSVWQDYLDGRLSMSEAASRASFMAQRNFQVVDSSVTRSMNDVVPDVVANQAAIEADTGAEAGPAPAIVRSDVSSDAKLLIIPQTEQALKGYRCFIALSDRARDERGEFFLQPHSTSIVWGGQKLLFVFEHHSGEFGLYYDLQTSQQVADESGGGPYPTSTIVLKDRIYIPIPESVAAAFVPEAEERKRFEVRCDLLYIDAQLTPTEGPG